MPRKDAPEFSYDPKTKLYRKRIKNEEGRWIPIYEKTKPALRSKVKHREAEIARIKEERKTPPCYQYFAEWFALWSPGKGTKHLQSVRNAINNHILPEIGNMRMVDISENDLLKVMNNVADKSQSLNKQIIFVLKNVFRAAVKEGVTRFDPAADIKAGGNRAAEKIPLTDKQESTLLDSVKGTQIYTFVLVVLQTGLRREEALGLQWDSVFLDATVPYLSVKHSVHWIKNRPVVSEVLKSDAARRDIPLPPQLTEHLKEQRVKAKGKFVFGGKFPLTDTGFRRRWEVIDVRRTYTEKIIDATGNETVIEHGLGEKIKNHKIALSIDFPVTPHLLRHTYITRLILSGVNIKVVQYLAGHANVDITLNIYTHLMENRPQDTAEAVLAAFDPPQILAPNLAPEEEKASNLAPIINQLMPLLSQMFTYLQTPVSIDVTKK